MRPAPTSRLRKVWNLFHWWFGRAVLLAGLGNFFFGVWMVNGSTPVYYIVPAVILLVWCCIAFVKARAMPPALPRCTMPTLGQPESL